MRRRTFSKSFKAAAVARVKAGETIRAVSLELGLHETMLRRWLQAGDKVKKPRGAAVEAAPASQPGLQQTKLHLILTAERLFVEKGIDGASLRQITREAGQRNETALQYHFTGREGLLKALLEYRMGPINQRRLAFLNALDAASGGAPLGLRDVAQALVTPVVEHIWQSAERSFFSELLHQIQVQRKYLPFLLQSEYNEGNRRAAHAYWLAQRQIPEPVAIERFNYAYAITGMLNAEIERDRWDRRSSNLAQSLWRASSAVDAIVTLWEAPVSPSLLYALHGVNSANMVTRWKTLHGITDDQPPPSPETRAGKRTAGVV